MRSGGGRWPARSEWPRSFSIPTICPEGLNDFKSAVSACARILVRDHLRQGAQRFRRLRQRRGNRLLQHPWRVASRHGAGCGGLEPASTSGAYRRPRFARRPHLPGASDHRRGRPLDVDRRRLDCRQDDARRADAQPRAAIIRSTALPSMSAMRPSGTAARWPPRARAPITGARSGSNRKKSEPRLKKGFKRVEIVYRLERLTPYENDTAECVAA